MATPKEAEISKATKCRRTFAIISHPDAGKTTITEKLLLYGGAIQMAGSVKAKRSKKFATSDWMELEKKTGNFCDEFRYEISVYGSRDQPD